MALKQGRCINCGSILFLDPGMPKGHCLFCDCVFDNTDAFRAEEHPEEFTFPNDKQPPYEGPSLFPSQMQRGPIVAAPKAAISAPVEKDDYVLPETKVPSLKIPMKNIVLFVAIAVAVVGIFLAVTFPMTAKRDRQQTEITDQFAIELPLTFDKTKDITVEGMTSTDVIIVLPAAITVEESIDLFNIYCGIRTDVLELKDTSFKATKKPVTLRIATPGGGYLIKTPADESALLPGAIKKLD
ncbi:MAG: hypothetical protein GX850_00430 [Clostridiaceae bacterium]|jgi:hypothetical protein|nr:hypothetical protein [Clostridiaceae bacterium]